MILSSKTTLKFSNRCKLDNLHLFIDEYKRVVILFIDELWSSDKIPSFLPQEYIIIGYECIE